MAYPIPSPHPSPGQSSESLDAAPPSAAGIPRPAEQLTDVERIKLFTSDRKLGQNVVEIVASKRRNSFEAITVWVFSSISTTMRRRCPHPGHRPTAGP